MSETRLNISQNSRGWAALETKLRAKGLTAGEIAEARKSFCDGIELLSKMFLTTKSMDSRFRGNDSEKNGNDKEQEGFEYK